MRRVLAIVVHNWPLKLAAVALATLLYAGVVLSENVQTFAGTIPIEPLRQPANAVIVGNLPSVTNIRYVAPTDVAGRLTRDGFTASVDLASATPTADNPYVTVRVSLTYADDRVRILDYSPQVIPVRLDPLVQKTVPIEVDQGPVPTGLQAAAPVLSTPSATVSGPDSVVRLVTAARARVLIQPSAIDVDQNVPLVAVDALGNQVGPADLDPAEVHVTIKVTGLTTTKSVPIDPVVIGAPADGFEVSGVDVQPTVATLEGDADALATVTSVGTVPLSIGGATADVSTAAALDLPDGLTAISGGQVDLTVHVRALRGTRTLSVAVRVTGARPDRTYALSTSVVTITLGGPLRALDRIDPATITATAAVGDLAVGAHAVRLGFRPPSGTTVVSIAPATISVRVAVPPPPPTATPAPTPAPSGP